MIYEVWYKNGIDLDYFGNREAAEKYIEHYIEKRKHFGFDDFITREEYEIREKEEPANNKGVVIPGCDWPTGCDYGIGG